MKLVPLTFSPEETERLDLLEKSRKSTSGLYPRVLILFLLFLLSPILGEVFFPREPTLVVAASVSWGAGLFVFHWYFFQRGLISMDDIPIEYKRIYLTRLLNQVLPGWKLSFGHRLSIRDIADSGLYRENLNSMLRDDHLSGKINNSLVEIFEISLQMKYRSGGGRYGGSGVRYADLFTGLFIRISTPVLFREHLWIFPRQKKEGGELDEWTGETIAVFAQYPTVKNVITNDSLFDARFVVFAANSVASLTELDQERRNRISKIASLFPFNSAFSFREKNIYLMIGFENDVFDFNLDKPVDNDEIDRVYVELSSIRSALELIAP